MNKLSVRNLSAAIAIICAVLVVLVCSYILFTDGGSGLSDNGDFQRVMDANGLKTADSSHSRYLFKRYYTMELDSQSPITSLFSSYGDSYLYKSCHSHFIKFSKLLNYTANIISGKSADSYDIFYLAFIYIIILAVSAYIIVAFFKKPLHSLLAALLFILLFCDAGHILYFNSLYGEAAQFVSLTLISALILSFFKKGLSPFRIIALCIAVYWFGGSKLANIPLALLILATIFVFIKGSTGLNKIVLSASALFIAVSLGFMYVSIPSWMNEQTTFQTIFFGILKESPTPEADLAELNLPEEYISLAGSHAYLSEYPIDITSPEFKQNFYEKIGKADAVIFYAKHPVRFIKKCAEAIRECTAIRPVYLGNSPHRRMLQSEKFSLWSKLRGGESIFTNPYIVLPSLFILTFLCIGLLIIYIKQKRFTHIKISAFVVLLICGIWANLLLPIAGNGDADLLKHMYLFIHLTDILLCLIIMLVITNLQKLTKTNSRKLICLIIVFVIALCTVPFDFHRSVTLGTYNGKPIEWLYSSNGDGTATLITKDVLFKSSFDNKGSYGSNLWAESDIRSYLNNEFLQCFNENELKLICDVAHKVTLSSSNAQLAQSGKHAPYWRASRINAADMYSETFLHTVTDKVYLPDTVGYSKGLFDKCSDEFYLIDPYSSSDSMVRFIDKNGIPIYCDAAAPMGIRPVITIFEVK